MLTGCWLHLSFRGHWPYRFRCNDGSCSELAPGLMFDNFLPIPAGDAESLPFYPLVLKLVVCVPCVPSPSDFTADRDEDATFKAQRSLWKQRFVHPTGTFLPNISWHVHVWKTTVLIKPENRDLGLGKQRRQPCIVARFHFASLPLCLWLALWVAWFGCLSTRSIQYRNEFKRMFMTDC